jgi:hypothetical protein
MEPIVQSGARWGRVEDFGIDFSFELSVRGQKAKRPRRAACLRKNEERERQRFLPLAAGFALDFFAAAFLAIGSPSSS